MKIRKNKKCKIILLCISVIIIAGSAVILIMVTKYNNRSYIQAKKKIEVTCRTEGLPVLFTDENVAKKEYLSGQARLKKYEWLYKLSEIIFLDSMGIYSMVNDDSIGDFIKSMEIEENGNKETYELYEVKNISSEYMIAVMAPEDGKYIGVTNIAYEPDDLETLKKDLQLENSYIELELYNDDKTVLYQNIDTEYICNKYLGGNKKYICRTVGGRGYNGIQRESLNLYMIFYQKSINQKIDLFIYEDGNIRIFLDNGVSYEYEADMEDTLEMLNYIVENYIGCTYISRY